MLSQPTILVCTDFSVYSNLALETAEAIRKKAGGRIHVVHVSEFPIDWNWASNERDTYYMDERLKQMIQQDIQDKLDKQIQDLKVECTTQIISGFPFSYIHEVIKEKKVDLVVIGHKGRTESFMHIGGIAEKMVASTDVPLLVIKKSMQLEKITGLVDPHAPLDKIINASEEFSSLFNAQLAFIALWKESVQDHHKDEVLNKVRAIIRSHISEQLECEVKVELGTEKKVAYQLLNYLREDKTDMVVMERHQKGVLEKFFIGSETRRMLELFQGNILVLPLK